MKLYNKTKLPDKLLKQLLTVAGLSVKARTSNVVVKVTQGRSLRSKGMAYRGQPYQWHLKSVKSKVARQRLISSDSGWIEITLPRLYSVMRMVSFPTLDAIELAKRFYATAQHEWSHIRDFQKGKYAYTPRTRSGRRTRWADRPCEISAMNQVVDAAKLDIDDMILELALLIEKQRENIKPPNFY